MVHANCMYFVFQIYQTRLVEIDTSSQKRDHLERQSSTIIQCRFYREGWGWGGTSCLWTRLRFDYKNLSNSCSRNATEFICYRSLWHYYMSRLVGKPTLWFPNRSDTNWAVQAQKRAISLKCLELSRGGIVLSE